MYCVALGVKMMLISDKPGEPFAQRSPRLEPVEGVVRKFVWQVWAIAMMAAKLVRAS